MKRIIGASRSAMIAGLLFGSGVAMAQTESPQQTSVPAPAAPVQGQAPAVDDAQTAQQSGQLQDIIVTAQKVENNVQKVPIAVQTISGRSLLQLGVQNTQDLQRVVPGLYVSATGAGGSSFYIRGVGTFNESPTTDSGLAVSLDQVFFSRAYGPDLALYDVERVEVLKGPQGTLYGRNATGGTVNIVSRKPVLGDTSGDFSVEAGNYRSIRVDGGYNLALGPTLALRAAFQINKHNGYFHDGYDDANTKAARVHLLWKPTSGVSLLLTGDYMNNDSRGPGITPYPNHQFVTPDPWDGGGSTAARAYVVSRNPGPNVGLPPTVAYARGGCLPGCLPVGFAPDVSPGPWQVDSNGFVNVTVKSVKAALDVDLGFATLTVIPGYLKTDFTNIYYKGSTPVYNVSSADQKTLEVRLASPADRRLSWIVGAFYFDEQQRYLTINAGTAPTALIYGLNPDYDNRSKALFAQASFGIFDSLKLTGGVRRTIDDKRSDNSVTETANYFPGPPPSITTIARSTAHSSANTYRVGLDWQVTPANLLYGYVATGFHAAGFNVGLPETRRICTPPLAGATPADFIGCDAPFDYRPEKLTAYAIGTKNRFFHNRLQLNIEAYYWKYKDLQVSHLGLINPSQSSLRTDNAGSATIKGVDAEASWLLTPDDLVSANANYNDSKFGQFVFYNVIFGRSVTTSNLTGKPFLNAPKFVAAFGYQHTFHLDGGATVIPSINGKYQSRIIFGYLPAGQTTDVFQDPFVKLDANLTYNAPGGAYSIGAFVRNLTNRATLLSASGGNTPGTNSPWTSVAPPRTYGVDFRAHF